MLNYLNFFNLQRERGVFFSNICSWNGGSFYIELECESEPSNKMLNDYLFLEK